jgi:uncharacterized protein
MSQEHIDRLREGYEGINRKDFDAVLALVHPDFVWENDPAGPQGATVYRGRAAVKGFWEDFLGSFDDFHQEPYEFREAAGGKILVRARLSTYLEGNEEPLRFDTTHLWTIRDDVPVHMRMYFDHGEALEAAGLREAAVPQANVEVLRAGFDAFNRGDYESWLMAFADDVEVHDLADTPDTGVFHGHAGVRAWLAKLQEAFGGGFRFEPGSFSEDGGVVIADVRASATGIGGGVPIDMSVYIVFRMRDGKIVWTQGFLDRGPALEAAAGMRESKASRPRLLTRRGLWRLPNSAADGTRRAGRRWSGLARRSSRRR